MIQQLGGVDANFLHMETAQTPMHVGSLYLYELPPGYRGDFYEDFKTHIADRLHLFPILTRKLVQLPFDLDAPLWMKDDAVDLNYHVRRHKVPKPGRFDQLEELVGRLHSNFLDRSRPLWEIYIIDGLVDGGVAEYAKFHHAGFDGAAAVAFVQSLYDLSPIPRPIPPPSDSSPEKEELDPLKLMGLVYANGVRQYLRAMQAIPDFLKAWSQLTLPDAQTLKLEPPELPHPAPRTRLNVSITSQRSYAARTVSLKDIKQIAKANGTTVNDVVLAICSGALRNYLREKKDLPLESLTAFVPVSVREAGNTEMNNQVLGMICGLATDVVNPLKRLLAIHDSSQKAKRLTDTFKSAALNIFSPWGAPFLIHSLMDMLGHHHLADRTRPLANLTISNNIGPPVPLYLAGAKLMSAYPMSIPAHGSALNITVQSYGDNLDVGVTACRHTVPDVRKLADYIVDAVNELKAAAFAPAATEAPPRTADKPAASVAAAKKQIRAVAGARPKVPPAPRLVRAGGKSKSPNRPMQRNKTGSDNAQPVSSRTLRGAAAANALGKQPVAATAPAGKNATSQFTTPEKQP